MTLVYDFDLYSWRGVCLPTSPSLCINIRDANLIFCVCKSGGNSSFTLQARTQDFLGGNQTQTSKVWPRGPNWSTIRKIFERNVSKNTGFFATFWNYCNPNRMTRTQCAPHPHFVWISFPSWFVAFVLFSGITGGSRLIQHGQSDFLQSLRTHLPSPQLLICPLHINDEYAYRIPNPIRNLSTPR